jgi:hypothetical protein
VELGATTGDQCSRGSVYFFDGESLLPNASQLAPSHGQETDGGLAFVSETAGISSPGPDEIAVLFVVSKPDPPTGGVSCAAVGQCGDRYLRVPGEWLSHATGLGAASCAAKGYRARVVMTLRQLRWAD